MKCQMGEIKCGIKISNKITKEINGENERVSLERESH